MRKTGRPTNPCVKLTNGCQYHSDCFTCPFSDCILGANDIFKNKQVQVKDETQRVSSRNREN